MHERPCPIDCCKTWITDQLCCARHWRQLPASIVSDIERTLRTSGRDSRAYRAACDNAVRWLNRRRKRRFYRVPAAAVGVLR